MGVAVLWFAEPDAREATRSLDGLADESPVPTPKPRLELRPATDLDAFDLEPGAPEGSDAPDAPRPPDLLPLAQDATQTDPASRAALMDQTERWLDEIEDAARTHDWNAVRAATDLLRHDPSAMSALIADTLRTRPDAERALAAGLVLEELLEDATLTEDERVRLGRAIVPELSRALERGELSPEAADHAVRLLSRFHDEQTESSLLALLADPNLEPARRLLVMFALAEVGERRTEAALRAVFQTARDPEEKRVAGLCLFRVLARLGGARVAPNEREQITAALWRLFADAAERQALDMAGRLALSLAEIEGTPPAELLARAVAGSERWSVSVRTAALELIGDMRDPSVLPLLDALRGRLGDPELERALERTRARLASLDPNG